MTGGHYISANNQKLIVPKQEVTIGAWTGVGYIQIDGSTKTTAYMISGGLNGGTLPLEAHVAILSTQIVAVMSAIELINVIKSTAISYIFPTASKYAVTSIQVTTITSIALLDGYLIQYLTIGNKEALSGIQDMLMLLSVLSLTETLFTELIYSMFIPVQEEPDYIPEVAKNYTNPETGVDSSFDDINCEVATVKLENGVWEAGPCARGDIIDEACGNNLGHNYPTFDNMDKATGTATSVKSRDLSTKIYQIPGKFEYTTKKDIDKVASFDNTKDYPYGDGYIYANDIKNRELDIIVPNKPLTSAQVKEINNCIEYGKEKSVKVRILVGEEY